MNDYIILFLLIIYTIISILNRRRYVHIVILIEVTLVIFVIFNYNLPEQGISKQNLKMGGIGYFIGYFWMSLQENEFYKNLKKIFCNINWGILLGVIYEEIIWRFCFLHICQCEYMNLVEVVLLGGYISFLFVFSHSDKRTNTIKSLFEIYIFSLGLMCTAALYPGMNIGLHLGRNVYCINKIRGEKE